MPNAFRVQDIGYYDKDTDGNWIEHSYHMPSDEERETLSSDMYFYEFDKKNLSINSLENGKKKQNVDIEQVNVSFKNLFNDGSIIKINADVTIDNADMENIWIEYVNFEFALNNEEGKTRILGGNYINYEDGAPYFEIESLDGEDITFDEIINGDKLVLIRVYVKWYVIDDEGNWSDCSNFYAVDPEYYDLQEVKKEYSLDADKVKEFDKINKFTVGD